jgi:hypothetical protein
VSQGAQAVRNAGAAVQVRAGELVSQGAQAVQDTAAATAQVAQDAASAFEPTFDVSGSVGTKYGSEEISFNRTWLEGKRGVPDHKSTTPDYMLQHKTQDSSYAPGLSVSVGVKPVAPEGEHADNPFAQAMAGVGFKGIKASADVSADTASKNNRVAQLDLSTGEMKNKTFDSGATVSGSVSIAADFAGPSGSYSAKVTPIDAALYKSGSYDVTSSAKLSRSSPHNPKLGASVDLANDKTSLSGTVPGGQKVAQELTAGVLGRNALDEQGGVNWEQAVPMAGDKAAQFGMNTLVQLPGLGVKALAEGGRHLAEGSEAAAREILKTGAYAAGNLGHQAWRPCRRPATGWRRRTGRRSTPGTCSEKSARRRTASTLAPCAWWRPPRAPR